MHDAEHEDDPILLDHVVHDPMVADAKAMERVAGALDRLDRLASDSPRFAGAHGEFGQCFGDPRAIFGLEFAERFRSGRGDLDSVCRQASSSSLTVRPLA